MVPKTKEGQIKIICGNCKEPFCGDTKSKAEMQFDSHKCDPINKMPRISYSELIKLISVQKRQVVIFKTPPKSN